VLRGQVRPGRLHPGAGRRAGRPVRGDSADPGRDGDPVLRRAHRAVQAGPGRGPQRSPAGGSYRAVRALPAARLRGTRNGGVRRPGEQLPVSVLVLRALGIGDLATAVPALRGLRAARPTEQIALAAPDWLTPLARLTGAVDRVVPVDGLDVARIPVPP